VAQGTGYGGGVRGTSRRPPLAVDVLLHVDEPILFLGATLVVPLWALSAAVYTFDSSMIAPGESWRRSS